MNIIPGKFFAATIAAFLVMISTALPAAGTYTYRDKLGRDVTVRVPVKRAVLFSTYELVPVLDAWDALVGVGRWAYDNDLMKAARPSITRVPSVGTGTDVNMEALMRLRPDIVITWTFKPEQVTFLEKKGISVIAVYPDSLAELYEVMRVHGRLFLKEARTDNAIREMEKLLALVRAHAPPPGDPRRRKVLHIGSRITSVSCGAGLTHEMISTMGGTNVAASIRERNAEISLERIIRWNPDVIFIWGSAPYNAGDILKNPQWKTISAVRAGRVYKTPRWSTWSPRLAPVLLWMAARTYPERYRDVDVNAHIDAFYRRVLTVPYDRVRKIEN